MKGDTITGACLGWNGRQALKGRDAELIFSTKLDECDYNGIVDETHFEVCTEKWISREFLPFLFPLHRIENKGKNVRGHIALWICNYQ